MPSRSKTSRTTTSVIAGCLIAATASAATSDRWNLPIATKKLDNGLTVVVSEDHSSPTVGISVVYRVGIRTEPRNRTGFAHLFEHLMFEGTPNAPHGVFDRVTTDGGGDNNGSTHPDFTSYIERAPVSALEPLLWLEADRMKTLAFAQKSLDGQRDVVKEEINVNVNNQPYGGFAETDLPLLAFQKWENGHDGYGSFDDLDKASVEDVRNFHRDFYGPNNAVLGIAGDVTPEQGFALAQKYFGAISSRATPPHPDVAEPLNTAEKRIVQGDGLAKLPALAVGWKMPPRGSRDQAAMVVLGELLAGGDASRLHQTLIKGSALAVQVDAFTGSGSPWEYNGPTLFTLSIVYKSNATADLLLASIDGQVARIQKEGVDAATLQGLKTRMLADWYDQLEPFVDRAETLAVLHAVWGDAKVANQVPDLIDGVTSADIQRVATTYLTQANRSVIDRRPDFMLADNDPARSDLREKNKPKPAKPKPGTVTVGGAQPVKASQAPAATAMPASGKAPVAGAPAPAAPAPAQPLPGKPASDKTPKASESAPANPPPAGTSTSQPKQASPDVPEPGKAASASGIPTVPTAARTTDASVPVGPIQPATPVLRNPADAAPPPASGKADSSRPTFAPPKPAPAVPAVSTMPAPPKVPSASPARQKGEPAKPEPAKSDTTHTAPGKLEPTPSSPVKPAPAKPAPTGSAPAKSESEKSVSDKPEPAKGKAGRDARQGPSTSKAAQPGTKGRAPVAPKSEPSKSESGKQDSKTVDSAKTDAGKPEPAKPASSSSAADGGQH